MFKLPFNMPNDVKYNSPDLVVFYDDLNERHIWLDQEINLDNCSFIIKYIQWLNRKESDDMRPIVIHISSGGGELYTGFMLYNEMKASKIPVHTINEGGAHSAAFMIFLAGSKRVGRPYMPVILHEGSGGAVGSFKESKQAMEQYEKLVETMKQIIVDETGIPMDRLTAEFEKRQDWYISPEEQIELGIISEVI